MTVLPCKSFLELEKQLLDLEVMVCQIHDDTRYSLYMKQFLTLKQQFMFYRHRYYRVLEKNFTLPELEQYNGKNNMPAYVAVDGFVYDISYVAAWGGATHYGLSAGKDLTESFNSCHQGNLTFLTNVAPVVGQLTSPKEGGA